MHSKNNIVNMDSKQLHTCTYIYICIYLNYIYIYIYIHITFLQTVCLG